MLGSSPTHGVLDAPPQPRHGCELREKAAGAVAGSSGLALATVVFVTVGREALETAIFLRAITHQSSPMQLSIGAAADLAAAPTVSFSMYRLGARINLGRFFTVMGTLLMVVAAGLLANAVQNLQELWVLPGGSASLWNLSHVLPDDSAFGDALHGIAGYSAAPTVLQAVVWAGFLSAGLALFLRRSPQPRPAESA